MHDVDFKHAHLSSMLHSTRHLWIDQSCFQHKRAVCIFWVLLYSTGVELWLNYSNSRISTRKYQIFSPILEVACQCQDLVERLFKWHSSILLFSINLIQSTGSITESPNHAFVWYFECMLHFLFNSTYLLCFPSSWISIV